MLNTWHFLKDILTVIPNMPLLRHKHTLTDIRLFSHCLIFISETSTVFIVICIFYVQAEILYKLQLLQKNQYTFQLVQVATGKSITPCAIESLLKLLIDIFLLT